MGSTSGDMVVIAKREITANCAKLSFISFTLFFISLTLFMNLGVYRSLVPKMIAFQPDIGRRLMDMMVAKTAVFTGLIAVSAMFQTFLREKIDRSIETLLCYPVSLNAIWLGRTLAVSTVYVCVCVVTAASMMAGVSVMEGHAVLPGGAAIVTAIVGTPLLGVGLFLLICLIYWITRVGRLGQALTFLVFFLAFFVGARPDKPLSPWLGLVIYAGVGLVCGLAAAIVRVFLLGRERIILQ